MQPMMIDQSTIQTIINYIQTTTSTLPPAARELIARLQAMLDRAILAGRALFAAAIQTTTSSSSSSSSTTTPTFLLPPQARVLWARIQALMDRALREGRALLAVAVAHYHRAGGLRGILRQQQLQKIRPEFLAMGILLVCVTAAQLSMPLSQFQSSRGIDTFRTPAAGVHSRLRTPETDTAKEYFFADQELYDDALPANADGIRDDDATTTGVAKTSSDMDSWDVDSNSALRGIGLLTSTPAMKWMEAYQYHHSQHRLEEEEDACHERTNRASDEDMSEVIDNGEWCPELHQRQYLVVDWVDFCNNKEVLQGYATVGGKSGIVFLREFVRSIAWAMVTQRTLLFREVGKTNSGGGNNKKEDATSCDGEECAKRYDVSECKGRARLDPWVPTYEVWKKEYGWADNDDSVIQVVQGDPSKLQFDTTSDQTLALTAKVIQFINPPPLSIDKIASSSATTAATTKANIELLLDFGIFHGMILDETILFKEAHLEELETSIDGFEDDTRTRRYAVQASAARSSSGCPALEFEQPCVIYQIGPEAIEPSACKVEIATVEKDLSSHKAVLEILAVAGNAIDGVVLDPKLPVGEFLVEFLRYRGRMEVRDFQLQGCWGQ